MTSRRTPRALRGPRDPRPASHAHGVVSSRVWTTSGGVAGVCHNKIWIRDKCDEVICDGGKHNRYACEIIKPGAAPSGEISRRMGYGTNAVGGILRVSLRFECVINVTMSFVTAASTIWEAAQSGRKSASKHAQNANS